MNVHPSTPTSMSDAQDRPSGLETPDSQQHSPSGVKSMFGKVKNKAKKLRNKIKNKTSGHGHDRGVENADPGSDDEDESGDQSPASSEHQEPKSEILSGNTGYGNRGFSFDKHDSAPDVSSPGAEAVQDRLGQLNLGGKDDRSASAAKKSPHVTFDKHDSVLDASSPGAGAAQDRLGKLQDRLGQLNLGGKDDKSASPIGKFSQGVPAAEKLQEETPAAQRVSSNLGSHERNLPSASPSDPLGTPAPAEDIKDGQPKDMFVPVQPTRDPVTRDLSPTPTDLSKASPEQKYGQDEDLPAPSDNLRKDEKGYNDRAYDGLTTTKDTVAGSAVGAAGVLGYKTSGAGDDENFPADRNKEDDRNSVSGPAVTDQYDDEQGEKGYKDRAYDDLVTTKDTVPGTVVGAAGAVDGYKTPAVGAAGALGNKISGADGNDAVSENLPVQAASDDDGSRHTPALFAEDFPADRNDEGERFPVSEPAVGEKGYKDRAYDGLVSAKDTIAGSAVGAAGALGYKASGAGGTVQASDDDASRRTPAATLAEDLPAHRHDEGDKFPVSEPAVGEKGYKDRAYDGLVSAKDTIAGSAVGAAGALGYKASGAGGPVQASDDDGSQHTPATAEDLPADRHDEGDKFPVSKPAVGEKGYKDRAYDGLVSAKDTIAGSAVGAAAALGYKASGAGGPVQASDDDGLRHTPATTLAENLPANQEEGDRFSVSEPTVGEKGYKDRAYDGLVTAKDTVAGSAAAAAGALGYKASGADGSPAQASDDDSTRYSPATPTDDFPADRNGEGDRVSVSEPVDTDRYGNVEGEKGYKDRAYEGLLAAKDTVAGSAVGAAGALGYKASSARDTDAVSENLPVQASNDIGTRDIPSTRAEDFPTDQYGNEEGEKGYKDRAYEGLVAAKDTVAGSAVGAAGALGYATPGEGHNEFYADQNKVAEEDELPVSEPATTDQYENVKGERGYKDRAYDGLNTAKDAAAGAAVAAAGAPGYKAYDEGKEKSPEGVGNKSLKENVPEDMPAAGATRDGYDSSKPELEGSRTETEPEMQDGEIPSERKSWLQQARETIGAVANYSPSASAKGQFPADEQDIGLPADEENISASDKQLPSGGESGSTIASRATGAVLGLRETLASKLGFGASSPTAAVATTGDAHGSQVEQPQAVDEQNYSLSAIDREGQLPEDEQDIGLPADEGNIPASDERLPSAFECGPTIASKATGAALEPRETPASKLSYDASSPTAAAATEIGHVAQVKQPQAADEQIYSPSAIDREGQLPEDEQDIGLPTDEGNIPASDKPLPSAGDSGPINASKATGASLGLRDTLASKPGYGASSPTAAASTEDSYDTQVKQPQAADEQIYSPSTSAREGQLPAVGQDIGLSGDEGNIPSSVKQVPSGGESGLTIASRATGVALGLRDTLASKFGYGASSPTATAAPEIGYDTQVRQPQAADKQNYSPSASAREGQLPTVEPDIGLPADEEKIPASAREGQLPAVGQDNGLLGDEGNIPASDKQVPSGGGGESGPTVVSRATGVALGLRDTLASKFGYGASSPTAAAATEIGHDTQVRQPQAADEQNYSPSASAREGQLPTVEQNIGLPVDEEKIPASEQLPSVDESEPIIGSKAAGTALGLKDTLASKLGFAASSPTATEAAKDGHGAQVKQPQAADKQQQLTSSANQLPSPSDGTPTVASRAAGGVLSLKDTLASTFGYGASSPTSVASHTPASVEDVAGKEEIESPNSKSYVQKLQEAAAGGKDSLLSKFGYEQKGVPENAGAEQQSIASLAKFGHGEQRTLPENVGSGDQHGYDEQRILPENVGGGDQHDYEEQRLLEIVGGDEHGYGEQRPVPENVGDDTESSNPQKSYLQKMQDTAYGAKDIMAAKLGYSSDSESPTGKLAGSSTGESGTEYNQNVSRFHPGEEDKALSQIITDNVSNSVATMRETLMSPFSSPKPPTTTSIPSDKS